MNQPLVLDQGGHVGATLHFQRHILYWKRWTIFQFFFLILSTLLGVCYISENNYHINGDYVPIIVGAQNLVQIVVYLRWRWAMKNKNNLINCAGYLNQQQVVNQGWFEEVDMHYYYRYTIYSIDFKMQLQLGYFFRIHMYSNYFFFIPIFFWLAAIVLTILYFDQTRIYQWQYLTFIVITSFITGFDLVALFTFPFYYFPKSILNYCRRKKHIKPYNPSSFDQSTSQCAICLNDYQKGEIVYILPCNSKHYFHQQCIQNWIQYQSICPFCRAEFIYLE